MSKEPRSITNWAISDDMTPYMAPEMKRLYLSGTCDGKPIKTSYVRDKEGPRTYRTKSGSLYRLDGLPDPGYVAFCASGGVTLDLEDPIKFRD